MVGYGENQKGYRIYNPKTRQTQVVRDIREDNFLQSTVPNDDESRFCWPEDWSEEPEEPVEPADLPEVSEEVNADDDDNGWRLVQARRQPTPTQSILNGRKPKKILLPAPITATQNQFSLLETGDV